MLIRFSPSSRGPSTRKAPYFELCLSYTQIHVIIFKIWIRRL